MTKTALVLVINPSYCTIFLRDQLVSFPFPFTVIWTLLIYERRTLMPVALLKTFLLMFMDLNYCGPVVHSNNRKRTFLIEIRSDSTGRNHIIESLIIVLF